MKDKRRKEERNTRCKCGNELHSHQIFCQLCGQPTNALKTELSARVNIKAAYKRHKENYAETFPLGLFLTLAVYLPIAVIVYLFWNDYWLTNLILLYYIPFALVPFAMGDDFSLKNYFSALKFYPYYWNFTLLGVIYFFLLKVICTGFLLGIMVDPVLHIVRLIMVLYGLACAFSAPYLMSEKKMNPIKAIIVSTKAGFEPRWQIFFILVVSALIISMGYIALLAGLLFAIPLAYKIMRRYYLKMDKFELFKYKNPTLDRK